MQETKISIEELKHIANNMEQKKEDIKEIYQAKVCSILKNGRLNKINNITEYDEIELDLKKQFEEFDSNMTELIEVLKNKIIPEYENLSDEIKNLFKNKLSKELKDLLEIRGETNE